MRVRGRAKWWWCWLSVLVASCSQTLFSSPGAQTATLSLLRMTPIPATPTLALRLLRTPPFLATRTLTRTAAPTPLPLPVAAPDCYETPVGGLWCLGVITNRLRMPVEQVAVQVYLVTPDGTALAAQGGRLAQDVLWPGQSAPYSVYFDRVPDGVAGPVAMLASVTRADVDARPPVEVRALGMQQDAGDRRVHVSGTLANVLGRAISAPAVTVTLLDERGRVLGYRTQRWPAGQRLQPGEALDFALDVTPQGAGAIRVEVSAGADTR
ncbi:MAG: hypothetical protein IT323_10265 [Anaerolineae bacterium]|nr:hypothetical protein [Anaerolineae bacterium]